MDSDTIWAHTDRQRIALCELLAGLDDEQWRHPSLCEGWTVRDVAAHVTFAQAGWGELLLPMLRAGLRPGVMIRRTTAASPLSHPEIADSLRAFVGSSRHVAGVSEMEPLIDVLVHTQDIAVPLGIEHRIPLDASTAAIERVLQLNRRPGMRLRRPLRDVRLEATDTEWSHGRGALVRGLMQWLLMYAAGREVAALHLQVADSPDPGAAFGKDP